MGIEHEQHPKPLQQEDANSVPDRLYININRDPVLPAPKLSNFVSAALFQEPLSHHSMRASLVKRAQQTHPSPRWTLG